MKEQGPEEECAAVGVVSAEEGAGAGVEAAATAVTTSDKYFFLIYKIRPGRCVLMVRRLHFYSPCLETLGAGRFFFIGETALFNMTPW